MVNGSRWKITPIALFLIVLGVALTPRLGIQAYTDSSKSATTPGGNTQTSPTCDLRTSLHGLVPFMRGEDEHKEREFWFEPVARSGIALLLLVGILGICPPRRSY